MDHPAAMNKPHRVVASAATSGSLRPACCSLPKGLGEHAFHRWVLGHHIAFGVRRMLIDFVGSSLMW